MLRGIYDWMMRSAEGPYALWALAAVSFVESSFFPIPPDVMLIPMILAAPHRAWWIATVCTVASVAGGVAGYGIGYFAFETLGQPIFDFYGKGDKVLEFQTIFQEWGAWAVLMAGVTPFPYKVITIASGAFELNMGVFVGSSLVARAIRFFAIGALLYFFGKPIRAFIERWFGLLSILFFVLLIGGFIAIGYLM